MNELFLLAEEEMKELKHPYVGSEHLFLALLKMKNDSSKKLNEIVETTAKENNLALNVGNTVCTDCFDVYMTDVNEFLSRIPEEFNPLTAEMEAFALFYNAQLLNKNACCLMSVVDSKHITKIATPEERQTGLNNMIKLALESAIKL